MITDTCTFFTEKETRQEKIHKTIGTTLERLHATLPEVISVLPNFLASAISQAFLCDKEEVLNDITEIINNKMLDYISKNTSQMEINNNNDNII